MIHDGSRAYDGGGSLYALTSEMPVSSSSKRITHAASAKKKATAASGGQAHSVRIIGGQWRGRRVRFPSVTDLRPTPDRVRETLFNWLQGQIADIRALDLFAGSGALGLEALSRGASQVVFLERDRVAANALKDTLGSFQSLRGQVIVGDAFYYLKQQPTPFGLVFLDPPFGMGRMAELCKLLEQSGWLTSDALIYIERSANSDDAELPGNWNVLRNTRAGAVRASLLRRVQSTASESPSLLTGKISHEPEA